MSLSREQMLVEMGISPIWVQREPGVLANLPVDVLAQVPVEAVASVAGAAAKVAEKTPAFTERPVSVPEIEVLRPIRSVVPQDDFQPTAATMEVKAGLSVDRLNWPELARQVAACKGCPLGEQRKQAVPGVGDLNPDWLFIGDGPGTEEDTQGEPFVGPAGKLLDNMLAALDISRGNKVYLTNAVKCRPPGNRSPETAEVVACRPYLERQIALLKPKIIVLLGKVAVHGLLHGDKKIAEMRGTRFEYAGIPVVVTYHPAYLLRNLPDKIKAWEDLLFARRLLRARASAELPF